MYTDITDIIKNLQLLTTDDTTFGVLKDFERVLDELDLYVFRNWEDGELLAGPNVGRYMVSCKFLWPRKHMPDPTGAERLIDYGCKVSFEKQHMLIPRKVRKESDFRPGTKKGKIDAHPVWVVTITMPKKLMHDIYQGMRMKSTHEMADSMKSTQGNIISSIENVQPEMGNEVPGNE